LSSHFTLPPVKLAQIVTFHRRGTRWHDKLRITLKISTSPSKWMSSPALSLSYVSWQRLNKITGKKNMEQLIVQLCYFSYKVKIFWKISLVNLVLVIIILCSQDGGDRWSFGGYPPQYGVAS